MGGTGVPFDLNNVPGVTRAGAPPVYSRTDVAIGGVTSIPGCVGEPYRGAVNFLTENVEPRVLLIPFCARSFAEVDPVAQTVTSRANLVLPVNAGAGFGGGVLGCDLRVYALPHSRLAMTRISPDAGTISMSIGTQPLFLNGGVLATNCQGLGAMPIVAAGRGGLYRLDVWEDAVEVTAFPTPRSANVQFTGVARLGENLVMSNVVNLGAQSFAVVLDTQQWVAREIDVVSVATRTGVAGCERNAFTVGPGGHFVQLAPDGGVVATRMRLTTNAAWPTDTRTGWVVTAGDDLVAWDTATQNTVDQVVISGLDAGQGGMLRTASGTLVLLPRTATAITLLAPAVTFDDPSAYASWFNKL